ncbi:MAG: transcription elongation factor GreA [Candidatus Cloacimonadota bacterium]|nr:MAG: transcription elongation factor GreA [Candidatus Cloacimonadota bacterium]
MSRGFVREDDKEAVPLVTLRAPLPLGVRNYVTPEGFRQLKEEYRLLSEERKTLSDESPTENRVQINYITAKLQLLDERIKTAEIISPLNIKEKNKVRFGAVVTVFREDDGSLKKYQITGSDEADISLNKISFLSPLAKALLNKKSGDSVTVKTPSGSINFTIKLIEYK